MKRFSTVYHDRFQKKPTANYSGLSMRLLPVLYFRLYLNTSHDVYLNKYTIILSLTVQKRKTSRISSVYAGFETFFIVNRYAYVAPSFWKNRMKGARARLSLIPGAEFSTRAYLSYKRLSYFFVCLHMFLIFAIGINSFEVSNPKAWCRESVSSLRL